MRNRILLFTTLLLLSFVIYGCGMSASRTLADTDLVETVVTISDKQMIIFLDDQKESRKNANRIFDEWTKENHIDKNISIKRLHAILPREDGCHITYDFRTTSGLETRITFVVEQYTKAYRKKKTYTR